MPEETQTTEVVFRDLLEMLLHGAVYDETNDTESIAALRLQADRTLRIWAIQVLQDALGNEQIALIDTNRVPWRREFENYLQIDGVELTGAEAALWTPAAPGNNAADHYEIYYHAANIDLASDVVALTIGHDLAGAGAIADAGFWARAEILPIGCNTGWRGPWVIAGDDAVRGNAAAVDDVAVSFRIRKVDIGA